MNIFLLRKALIFFIVAVMLCMLPGNTFAQIIKVETLGTEEAMSQLELLEQQRKQEELYFQMGLGLSEELRDGYIGLAAQYKNIPDVVAWSEYRIAEYDYSRDEFEEAIRKLLDIVSKYPNSDIGVEAQILAAEIAESPYNPNRDSARAAQILMLTKSRSLSSNPNERIQLWGMMRLATKRVLYNPMVRPGNTRIMKEINW
ncbi:tetratricopeptide repeat protein [Paenibacillus ihumii]|uniref:tetratricopeptide repeat protein n=1 Tax=Paenibacillus ihumii TaxID=687436 RepID=UPI0006D82349|nr:hypothetical protein [Paenibacillus ihumii]